MRRDVNDLITREKLPGATIDQIAMKAGAHVIGIGEETGRELEL